MKELYRDDGKENGNYEFSMCPHRAEDSIIVEVTASVLAHAPGVAASTLRFCRCIVPLK